MSKGLGDAESSLTNMVRSMESWLNPDQKYVTKEVVRKWKMQARIALRDVQQAIKEAN